MPVNMSCQSRLVGLGEATASKHGRTKYTHPNDVLFTEMKSRVQFVLVLPHIQPFPTI